MAHPTPDAELIAQAGEQGRVLLQRLLDDDETLVGCPTKQGSGHAAAAQLFNDGVAADLLGHVVSG